MVVSVGLSMNPDISRCLKAIGLQWKLRSNEKHVVDLQVDELCGSVFEMKPRIGQQLDLTCNSNGGSDRWNS